MLHDLRRRIEVSSTIMQRKLARSVRHRRDIIIDLYFGLLLAICILLGSVLLSIRLLCANLDLLTFKYALVDGYCIIWCFLQIHVTSLLRFVHLIVDCWPLTTALLLILHIMPVRCVELLPCCRHFFVVLTRRIYDYVHLLWWLIGTLALLQIEFEVLKLELFLCFLGQLVLLYRVQMQFKWRQADSLLD